MLVCVGLLGALALGSAEADAPEQGAEADTPEQGELWLLRQYRVPGCEPMPRVPVVFNWLVRKALAIEEFLATSVDCGQIGRRGSREGWNYVFWMEREETAVAELVRRAKERYGLTAIVPRLRGQSWSERAESYEPFVLIQLPGEDGPVRVWAAGDAILEVEISAPREGRIEVGVSAATYDGKECFGRRELRPGEPGGPRERLPCQAGGG